VRWIGSQSLRFKERARHQVQYRAKKTSAAQRSWNMLGGLFANKLSNYTSKPTDRINSIALLFRTTPGRMR
jgi:hypothetical protein